MPLSTVIFEFDKNQVAIHVLCDLLERSEAPIVAPSNGTTRACKLYEAVSRLAEVTSVSVYQRCILVTYEDGAREKLCFDLRPIIVPLLHEVRFRFRSARNLHFQPSKLTS